MDHSVPEQLLSEFNWEKAGFASYSDVHRIKILFVSSEFFKMNSNDIPFFQFAGATKVSIVICIISHLEEMKKIYIV